MGDDSDRVVWESVLRGRSSDFGLIWDRHRGRVTTHLRMFAPVDEVEDLVASTFLELWRRRKQVRFVDDSLLPWLIVTARYVAKNAARTLRRYNALLDELPPAANAPDPADVVAARDSPRVRFAREVLTAARPADRDLVVLTAVEGFTVAQAAAALGISESAARMRLSRMRQRIDNQATQLAATEGTGS